MTSPGPCGMNGAILKSPWRGTTGSLTWRSALSHAPVGTSIKRDTSSTVFAGGAGDGVGDGGTGDGDGRAAFRSCVDDDGGCGCGSGFTGSGFCGFGNVNSIGGIGGSRSMTDGS